LISVNVQKQISQVLQQILTHLLTK